MPAPPRVKICCIADAAEMRMAVAAGANLVGLVGAMPSGPGPIPDADIAGIAAATPPGVTSVLLTSETTPEGVRDHALRCRPAAVQLVDECAPGTVRALRAALPCVRVLQVIHVEDEMAVAQAREALRGPDAADALLLDSGRPSAAVKELGGTGRPHDWTISARIVETSPAPVFLAGGLTPVNVLDAIRVVRPWGLDLCGGVRVDGRLDADRLSAFMAAVRRAA